MTLLLKDDILSSYDSFTDCVDANDGSSYEQNRVDYKMGMYNDVLVSASWAVPLDDENRQPRLCASDAWMLSDEGEYYDYYYCTSVPGQCGLSFVNVCCYNVFKTPFYIFFFKIYTSYTYATLEECILQLPSSSAKLYQNLNGTGIDGYFPEVCFVLNHLY